MKYLESMANALNVDYEKFMAVSKACGILKKDGFPMTIKPSKSSILEN